MNQNDKLASTTLSAKVGTLRVGAQMSNDLDWIFDEAADDIRTKPSHVRSRITSLASRAGAEIERSVEAFAERRLDTLHARLNKVVGGSLKKPSSPGSLKIFRGSVAKFIGKSAKTTKSNAPKILQKDGSLLQPRAALKKMRHDARSITRSSANAAHNAAVLAVARSNKNMVQAIVAMATLDDRTTKHICIPRHGGAWDIVTKQALSWSTIDIPFPGRPPWHFNCRTTLSIVLRDEAIPTEQTKELDRWVKTPDAVRALGSDRVDLFKNGVITRSQLVSQDGRPLPLDRLS